MYPENPFTPKRNQFGPIYPGGQATRPVIYPPSPTAPGSSLTQPPRIRGEYYMPDPGEGRPWDIYRRQDPSQSLQPIPSVIQPPRIRGEYYMPDPGERSGGFFADLLRRAMSQFGQTQQGQLPNLYNLRGMGGQFGGFSDVQDPYRAFFTRLLS